MSDDTLTEHLREKKMKRMASCMTKYERNDIKNVGRMLAAKKNHGALFRLWCELVSLTGEI